MIPAPVYDDKGWCIACGRTRVEEHAPFCASVRRAARRRPAVCSFPGCDTHRGPGGLCSAHLNAEREARG